MKRNILLIITIVLVIIVTIIYNFSNYRKNQLDVQNNNKSYQSFYNVQVLGTDLATLINKVENSNIKNNVEKDEKGYYIDNGTNSIKIDIKFLEMDKVISAEAIQKNGIEQFVHNFASMNFKCTKIEYHQNTKNVKYMYFEQV